MLGTITTHESGGDLVIEWQIPRFSTLRKDDGAGYCSPDFCFGGERWCLNIFPNGASECGTSGHVDLGLFKYPSGRSIGLSVSLSLKTAKGERHREEHYTKEFDDGDNWFHRFNRFFSRTELTTLRSDLLPDDVLTVVCTMKGRSSAGSESDSASAEISNSDSESDSAEISNSDSESHSAEISAPASDSAGCSSDSGKCRHCRGNFAAGILSSHQRKCEQRPVKCPDCQEVVVLQKFLNEHECQLGSPEGVRFLCEDYKEMLLDGRDHNVILKVGEKELRAHRDVLRVRSRVFKSMLDHDMKEKNTGVIDVSDCDPDAMELFLSYVYCGKIDSIDHSNMLGLYYVADKYEMMELKRECSDFIKKSLSHTNICSVIQLALNHSDSELLDCATEYFGDNMVEIMQTVEWQSFLKENSTVGNELLLKSVKKLKNA